ncbi:MAG: DUF2062 domain-containing protein [Nitrospirota bacterium]
MGLRDRIRSILSIKESPHRIAASFAIGVFVAFTPSYGLHTISAILLSWAFRLNKVVTLTGTLVNNPWTIAFIYGPSLWLGMVILDQQITISSIPWKDLGIKNLLIQLESILLPFVIGTFILGILAGLLSYHIILKAILRIRSSKKGGF